MLHWAVHLCRAGTPVRPYDSSATLVLVGHNVYYFGGYFKHDNSDEIAVHILNTVSLRWTTLPPVKTGREECRLEVPPSLFDHTAVLIEDTAYISGGHIGDHSFPFSNVLYAFDVDTHTWFKVKHSGIVQKGRIFHSACVLEKVMYICGGYDTLNNNVFVLSNDICTLDTTTMVWSLINTRGTPPYFLCNLSATIIGTKMFVFEGELRENNIRVFDTETNCWLSMSCNPSPTEIHHHSAFAYNGELYIFCRRRVKDTYIVPYWEGERPERERDPIISDLWKFNPETISWKKVEPKGDGPGPGFHHLCSCVVGDRIILFEGHEEESVIADDLYILDFNPSLKTLCKLAVIQYGLEQSGLTHDVRWELATMINKR